MFDKFKTFVARSGAASTQNALSSVLASSVPAGQQNSIQGLMSQAVKMGSKLFEEKEWQCPCGHKFRAGGDWVACAPIHCEVPSCPNPKYYVDGPGRALLEANPQGVRLKEVTSNNNNTIGSDPSTPQKTIGHSMSRLGGSKK